MPFLPGLPGAAGLPGRRRRATFHCLDEHPNRREIFEILDRLPSLTEREVTRLARGWRDNHFLAEARDRALSPNSPLVVDVLAAFDKVDAVFFDTNVTQTDGAEPADAIDIEAKRQTLGVAVRPHLANVAVKAVRDALAAAYARPILRRAEHIALIGPWRRLFPTSL